MISQNISFSNQLGKKSVYESNLESDCLEFKYGNFLYSRASTTYIVEGSKQLYTSVCLTVKNTFFSFYPMLLCRAVGTEGPGGAFPPPHLDFSRSVKTIATRDRADYADQITTCPLGFSDLHTQASRRLSIREQVFFFYHTRRIDRYQDGPRHT